MASIPGMGIPEQLKAAMEQEQSSRFLPRAAWTSHTERLYLGSFWTVVSR